MNYSEVKNSEFFKFFNLSLVSSNELNSGDKEFRFKPGGFKDYIDIVLWFDMEEQIKKGKVILDREWIGDYKSINPYGTDISKSFIALLFPENRLSDFKRLLVHYLFNLRGDRQVHIPLHKAFQKFEDSAPKVKPFLDVYRGEKEREQKSIGGFTIKMENIHSEKRERLLIQLSWV
jgi:hypothetical protein